MGVNGTFAGHIDYLGNHLIADLRKLRGHITLFLYAPAIKGQPVYTMHS